MTACMLGGEAWGRDDIDDMVGAPREGGARSRMRRGKILVSLVFFILPFPNPLATFVTLL